MIKKIIKQFVLIPETMDKRELEEDLRTIQN